MDSLVGYGSDDEVENDRYGNYRSSVSGGSSGGPRRKEDDTNYDDVNMDMSEDSQGESEPELPPAEPQPRESHRDDRKGSENRDRERREERPRARHESPRDRHRDRDADRRDARRYREERKERSERRDSGSGAGAGGGARRGLLGDRPDAAPHEANRMSVPALMDLKPFGDAAPHAPHTPHAPRPDADHKKAGGDARDAVSPRFAGERRERDREHRPNRRSEEKKSHKYPERNERSRSRGAGPAFPPPPSHGPAASSSSTSERSAEYRPSSYKVNKKLEVMEKMGLQIKTPDGHMATAQQLRAGAGAGALPGYCNAQPGHANKMLNQVQKRKLLWSGKSKSEAEEAAKWSGTRFAQDNDGKQVSKFMRLMGIKEPAAVKPEPADATVDPIKKQEELFQAMQAQYEVARATTHTMRGVGLGFQRQY